MRGARRLWAIAAIRGEAKRLAQLHDAISKRFQEGDRIIYLGDYVGHGGAVLATIDELLDFRRRVLGRRGGANCDVVFLRGAREETWQKLLQLQFAPNPREVLNWMVIQGVGATIAAYGGDIQQGTSHARDGAVALTRWSGVLRSAMQACPGHYQLMAALRRAAYTDDNRLLFVSAGIDPERPLSEQSDSLWWGGAAFSRLDHAFGGFIQVVRGFDRAGHGIKRGPFSITVDGGCGFGGPLVAACLTPEGEIGDLLQV